MNICKNCKKELYDETQICDGCGNLADVAPEVSQTAETKKPKKSLGIISTILIIVIARLIGGYLGEQTANTINDSSITDDIDTFIEQVTSKYTPGTLTDESYYSPYFEFEFEANENWIMYDKSDVQSASEQSKQSAFESGLNVLKEEKAPEKFIEKWKQSAIFNVEMMADYEKDGIIAGENIIIVYTAYGIQEMSKEESFSTVLSNAGFSEDNIEKNGTVKIAGIPFEHIKATVVVEDEEIVNNILICEKNNIICMILNRAVKGCEDDVFNSMLNSIK